MTCVKVLLIGLLAIASVAVADDPPPFGTVLGQWDLQMSGAYAGAGITWRQDSGFLYLMDQGYSGPNGVWKLDPADPTGTIRPESWVFPNMGDSATDIPYGICWDPDSGCFWASQILDGSVYAGCYLLRMAWWDSAWCWRGTPADSWRIDPVLSLYWMAGMAKWQDLGYFVGTRRPGSHDSIGFVKFDPYTKTRLGFIPCGSAAIGIGLVPADSYYIIGTHWYGSNYYEWDTTGQILRRGTDTVVYGAACLAVVVPEHPGPQDTAVFYCISSEPTNMLQKVSVGLLWGQLRAGGAIAEPPGAARRVERTGATVVRGVLELAEGEWREARSELLDIMGRRALALKPGANDVSHLPAGIFFVRAVGRKLSAVGCQKVIVTR